VRIYQGVFTHEVAASTQVQINLFGYGVEGFTRVLQNTEEALEAHDGGLLHIYTTRSQIEERRKHGGELSASAFLFATVANALQPAGAQNYLIETLPKMSVQYDLLHEDDKTSLEEMREILDLAGLIGMLPDPASFISELRKEFPDGLGIVRAKYVVRYESEAVAAAFQLQDAAAREQIVRETMRHFIAAIYIGMRPTDWAPRLGFAYRDRATFDAFARLGFAAFGNSHINAPLPSWFTKGPSQKVELQTIQKQTLIKLYNVEHSFLDRLKKLYEAIDGLRKHSRAITAESLNKHVKAFIEMSDDLDQFRENAFFAVFDRLVMEGSGGKAPRSSALVLEITQPGGGKVTKVLTAAAPRPASRTNI
jgi:hypothetical protein